MQDSVRLPRTEIVSHRNKKMERTNGPDSLTAYEWYQTSYKCLQKMRKSSHVDLEPRPLHHDITCSPAVAQDYSQPPKSGQTTGVVMAWSWIHLPIHSIWLIPNTLYIIALNKEIIPCGSGVSTTAPWHHLKPSCDHRFQPTAKIWAKKCGCNRMMMYPSAHTQHMTIP